MNPRAAVLGALLLAGCAPVDPAPEDIALDRLLEADELYAAGRFAEAEPQYAYVIAARDRCREAYVRMSVCQSRLGRDTDAIVTLRRLLGVDAYHPEGLKRLADLLVGRGQEGEALPLYRRLLELKPGDEALQREISRLEKQAVRGK